MRITRSKAIKLKCLDCCCGQAKEVRLCPSQDCPLWNYRFGDEIDSEGKRIARREGPKNAFQHDKTEQYCNKNNN